MLTYCMYGASQIIRIASLSMRNRSLLYDISKFISVNHITFGELNDKRTHHRDQCDHKAITGYFLRHVSFPLFLAEEIFINLLDVQGFCSPHADIVTDHQGG